MSGIIVRPVNNIPNNIRNTCIFGIILFGVLSFSLVFKGLFKDLFGGALYGVLDGLSTVLIVPTIFLIAVLVLISVVSSRFIQKYKFDTHIPRMAQDILGAEILIFTDQGFTLRLTEPPERKQIGNFIHGINKTSSGIYKYELEYISKDRLNIIVRAVEQDGEREKDGRKVQSE